MISPGVLILLGSYLAWAGGAFFIVYSDVNRRPLSATGWGMMEWGALSAVAGGLALPFYFSSTRGTNPGLLQGIGLGMIVAVFAYVVRMGLSYALRVPIV